jgi:hypothetical protein
MYEYEELDGGRKRKKKRMGGRGCMIYEGIGIE